MPTRPTSRHHVHRHRLRGHGYFKRLGPGLVTGAADDDPSGIGTYSQVGARFGVGYVWSTLFLLPMAAAVQETAARLGLATGRGLARLIRDRFSRPVLVVAVVLVCVANTFNVAADIASMGAATHVLVGIPRGVLVVAFTALMLALEIRLPYRRYSRVLRWFALSLGAYIVVLFAVHVPWATVARHSFVPQLRFARPDLAALLAVFGTTVSPYLFFWQASEEVEEEAGDNTTAQAADPPALDADHVAAMRVDVVGGMWSGLLVAFSIMVASAVTLHAHGLTEVGTAEEAARALRPIAGDLAGLLFAGGIVGLGLLAVPVLAGSTAYALSEAFGWHEGLARTFREARGFYWVIVASMFGGLAINALGIDPIRGLFLAAILNGVAAPPLMLLMLLLARERAVMGEHRSGALSTAVMVATIAASTILPIAWLLA